MATRDELYAKFGLTAEAAQLFETDLGTMLLAFEGGLHEWHLVADPERASEFYERLNKKTLGQLLEELKKYADIHEDVASKFTLALTARNRLNHGFFERHNFAIQTHEGRDDMLADLESMHHQLFEAWQIAQRASAQLTERLQAKRGHPFNH